MLFCYYCLIKYKSPKLLQKEAAVPVLMGKSTTCFSKTQKCDRGQLENISDRALQGPGDGGWVSGLSGSLPGVAGQDLAAMTIPLPIQGAGQVGGDTRGCLRHQARPCRGFDSSPGGGWAGTCVGAHQTVILAC